MIPYTTDAPIYHFPKATIGLIVATVLACFVAAGTDPEAVEPYLLVLGEGLHPFQWLTGLFLHDGLGSLVGNMIFLWAFGIVVEGKVGALRMLAIYLGIGVVQAALEQVLFLRLEEPLIASGASGAIYGLLAICLVWAPKNDLSCIVFFRFSADVWEIPILTFAGLYLALEVLGIVRFGLNPSTELAHLSGAAIGFVVGAAMVKLDWVDCEHWDLFAVLAGRQGRAVSDPALQARKKARSVLVSDLPADLVREQKAKKKAGGITKSPEQRAADAARRVGRLVEMGDTPSAIAAYRKAADELPGWPTEPDLRAWIKDLLTQQATADAVPLMADYCRKFPDQADRMRLKLGQIVIRDQQRPARGLRLLGEIAPGALPPQLDALRRQLVAEARQMQEEGVLELEGDD